MKRTLTTALLSIAAIIIGYISMALPFRLFEALSQTQMRLLLGGEILIYISIFSAYFCGKEAKAQRRVKDEKMKAQHNERIARRNEELKGIRVNNFDLAA